MARDQSAVTRAERNAALVEVMLLASMADGPPSDIGMQALIERVLERPEFDGTKADELTELVQRSAKTLASAEDLEAILHSLRSRLPTHQHRMLAFGLAVDGGTGLRVSNYYVAVGLLAMAMALLLNLVHSRVGRALRASSTISRRRLISA